MDTEMLQEIARQLRQPEGELGKKVGETMNDGNRFMNLEAIKTLDLQEGDKVLEVGMGNGQFVSEIVHAAPDIRYTGCDFSVTMIEEATDRNKALIEAGSALFIKTEASRLPFDDENFDKAITVNTVYFWEEPERELAEIRRVLKQEGKLVMGIRPEWCMKELPFTSWGFRMYSKEAIIELLTTNGFEVLQAVEHTESPQTMGEFQMVMGCIILETVKRGSV